jgi:hypothetical protein
LLLELYGIMTNFVELVEARCPGQVSKQYSNPLNPAKITGDCVVVHGLRGDWVLGN